MKPQNTLKQCFISCTCLILSVNANKKLYGPVNANKKLYGSDDVKSYILVYKS